MDQGMRIYISADIEGVNGVVSYEHANPEGRLYGIAREWMIAEVNAAIEGCLAAGATEVVVNDAHNRMVNLLVNKMHPAARLITGHEKPMSMMEGIDGSFAAAVFLGYHAKAGTARAVHDHTFSASTFHDVRVNGKSVGEFGLNAALAGQHGVPVVLVTGDEAVCREASDLSPTIHCVAVKRGVSRYAAECMPFRESLRLIREGAERAVRDRERIEPLRFESPFLLECVFQRAEQAERVVRNGIGQRLDACTLAYETADYLDLYRTFLAMLRCAN